MPTHIRAHVQWQVGSMLPKDIHQITPCFRHQLNISAPLNDPDWATLATDLADIFASAGKWVNKPTNQTTVKLYEIKPVVPGEPNRPRATVVRYPGTSAEATQMREVALCLSFYGGSNYPQNRGRLYLPAWLWASSIGVRPAAADITKVGLLPPMLAALGGSNVDWGVWSPTKQEFTRAEHWFVDDEWDIQRRRGLPFTARVLQSTSG